SPEGPWHLYLKWALLGTLRDVASVRVGWPYQRPNSKRKPPYADTAARFRQRTSWIIDDLLGIQKIELDDSYSARILNADSRNHHGWRACLPQLANGCVSSPPYLNNFDYADATRLELYFWGEVTTWAEMCSSVRTSMITSTTQQSNVSSAKDALMRLSSFTS